MTHTIKLRNGSTIAAPSSDPVRGFTRFEVINSLGDLIEHCLKTAPTCRHPKAARMDGPRQAARWGSFATEVCTRCGSWRVPGRRWWHRLFQPVERSHELE